MPATSPIFHHGSVQASDIKHGLLSTTGMTVIQSQFKVGVEAVEILLPSETPGDEGERVAPTSVLQTIKTPSDVRIYLKSCNLVDLRVESNGWFAVLAVDQSAYVALDEFSSTIKHYIDKSCNDKVNRAFVTPFEASPRHELDAGMVVRVRVKVGEYANRIMHTRFTAGASRNRTDDLVQPLLGQHASSHLVLPLD